MEANNTVNRILLRSSSSEMRSFKISSSSSSSSLSSLSVFEGGVDCVVLDGFCCWLLPEKFIP